MNKTNLTNFSKKNTKNFSESFQIKSPINISQIFWLIIFLHMLIWTITPTIIRHALSDDFIEAVTWGQQFSWGYDKNPWLTGWLAHLGILIGGQSGIGIYFIQALFIAIGLISVWQIVKKSGHIVYAFIAAIMYEACACYSVDLQIYNDNYILMGLLPLASLFFYRSIQKNYLSDWLIAAMITGLAVMAKYDAILFAISIFCFLISQKKRWQYATSRNTWLALFAFLLIISPNIIWLIQHDFSTLTYAFNERANFQNKPWLTQTLNNLNFIWLTLLGFIPAFILLLFAIDKKTAPAINFDLIKSTERKIAIQDNIAFLFWAGFGPIILLILLGFILGLTLHREWGNTFISLWGAFILLRWHPNISLRSFKRFIIAAFVVLFFWPIADLIVSFKKDTGNFPAKEMANIATDIWHDQFHSQLKYVAGDRYTAGYVGLHSSDHPAVWMEWNNTASTWIDEKNLRCHGALFIQDSGHTRQHFFSGLKFPDKIIQKFPTLKILNPISIPWYRNNLHRPDLKILIGLLPPDKTQCI